MNDPEPPLDDPDIEQEELLEQARQQHEDEAYDRWRDDQLTN